MRYEDEKYVEALEEEVKALRIKVGLYSGKERGGSSGGRGWGKSSTMASATQTEELYRRVRTEVAAEAGAGYGRVSLEALYLLPSEFTHWYQVLFLSALKESPGQTGEANPLVKKAPRLTRKGPGHENTKVKLGPSPTTGRMMYGEAEVLDRDPDRGGGQARSGGKRHRDHWLIKDERAFRLKSSIDKELVALANVVSQELAAKNSRAAGNGSLTNQAKDAKDTAGNDAPRTPQCARCTKFLKVTWKYCPSCGSRVE